MGMAVSLDVRDDVEGMPGLAELVAWLHHVDRTFSTYLPESQISRLGRGELHLGEVTAEVRDVLLECEALRQATGGAFDAFVVPAPNGTTLDPSGYVKGWAIERAAGILEANGLHHFAVNAGGDVVVRGTPTPDPAWRVGVRDPADAARLSAVLVVEGSLAVATSGTYERGAHLIDPRTGAPTADVASVTVAGPDLGRADAYATAVFVMGEPGMAWLSAQDSYEGLMLTHDDRRITTAGIERWMVADPASGVGHQPDRGLR